MENGRGQKPCNTSKKTGMAYEEKAAEYLINKGYQILKRNFYSPFGEIDMIARDGDMLVFVEVKYRADARGGHPLEAVDGRKQQRIRRAAQFYCLKQGIKTETACRFDVIGIMKAELIHIKDAF